MKTETPVVKYLKDYTKPTHKIDKIDLVFELDNTKTRVISTMHVIPHEGNTSLFLDGEELEFISAKVDGELVSEERLSFSKIGLTIKELPTSDFTLEITNIINPEANTALDGLYKSGGIFCTQNEPEGFRRITYFIDRPDNLSIYTTKIIANKKDYPVLLSNGNLIDSGDLEDGLHFATWKDPFYKPAYLYALVAGDLGLVEDKYTTVSGRVVDLQIFVDKGNESKCHHAMESLKNSMKWDEQRFGLEYDLDIYMIVAVDSFNMGAMENKGLNIFNSAYVLADKETATDDNYFGIEAVIGHEYFHNWTGNRITCRDWFQLTLKEGLTVFRDQEFSADLNSRAVCRINDVKRLRTSQFTEDAGPTAHPIKPKSYIEMNNFYTATIYEKGAEVIRMVHTMLGEEGFRKGMDKYFELFDGQAVTTEDFIHSMSIANDNYDFSQFKLWYDQAGTPVLDIEYRHDVKTGELTLKIKQSCPDTPEQTGKKPFHMPFKIGLVGCEFGELRLKDRSDQKDIDRGVLHLKEEIEEFTFEVKGERVVPSLNRGFSAPVNIHSNLSDSDLAYLMANDSDEFARYEAGFVFSKEVIDRLVKDINAEIDPYYTKAIKKIVQDREMDNAFKSLMLTLPTVADIVQDQKVHDYKGTFNAIEKVTAYIATEFDSELRDIYSSLNVEEEFSVDAKAMGQRALKNTCLLYLATEENGREITKKQFDSATNMTDMLCALKDIVHNEHPCKKEALDTFYNRFKDQTLVMQKWLRVQAESESETTYDTVHELLKSDIYDENVPNLVRSLVAVFCANKVQFNHESGRGIKFAASQIKKLDKINPQVASRIASYFKDLKHMPENLKAMAKSELESIIEIEDLSKNVYEIVSKILA